jgi:hypothetical protein
VERARHRELLWEFGEAFLLLGEEYNALPIFGAWQPVRSRKAFEVCFLTVYERVWDDACLPPRLGERADGPSHLICEAVFNILAGQPGIWDEVCEVIACALDLESERDGILDAAAEQSGIPRPHLETLAITCEGDAPVRCSAPDRRGLVALFWNCIKGNPF